MDYLDKLRTQNGQHLKGSHSIIVPNVHTKDFARAHCIHAEDSYLIVVTQLRDSENEIIDKTILSPITFIDPFSYRLVYLIYSPVLD